MPHNLELKARIASLEHARAAAAGVATSHGGPRAQRDTYFAAPHGRLKLRESPGRQAELIWYLRPDAPGARESRYLRIPVDDAAAIKEALGGACGIRSVVEKHRDVYFFHNVRIHLDQVAGRGEFLEFEAVLDGEADQAPSQGRLEFLVRHFALRPEDFVSGSYGD